MSMPGLHSLNASDSMTENIMLNDVGASVQPTCHRYAILKASDGSSFSRNRPGTGERLQRTCRGILIDLSWSWESFPTDGVEGIGNKCGQQKSCLWFLDQHEGKEALLYVRKQLNRTRARIFLLWIGGRVPFVCPRTGDFTWKIVAWLLSCSLSQIDWNTLSLESWLITVWPLDLCTSAGMAPEPGALPVGYY